MTSRSGRFFSFEGADGAGKTTQIGILARRLTASGYDIVQTQEPGGTNVGRHVRSLVLDVRNDGLCPMSELLLYFAARAQNFEEVIVPAWETGKIVICDRWTDSTLAYQGGGRGLDRTAIRRLDEIVCHGEQPDRTIYLDVDLPTALNRARLRNPRLRDRMEEQSAEFHARVRAAYLEIAAANPNRIIVINGEGHPEVVADRIWAALAPALPPIA